MKKDLGSLVRQLREALLMTQFGAFAGRRCPVCTGWNVGANGETDFAHTAECPVAQALADSIPSAETLLQDMRACEDNRTAAGNAVFVPTKLFAEIKTYLERQKLVN